jgi:hypothetical protein
MSYGYSCYWFESWSKWDYLESESYRKRKDEDEGSRYEPEEDWGEGEAGAMCD